MKIYEQRAKISSSRLDREEEVVEMLKSGEWRIYSSPEGPCPPRILAAPPTQDQRTWRGWPRHQARHIPE